MKILPLALFVCLALSGCATTTTETSQIVRHLKAPEARARVAISKSAEAHGYHELSPGMFQKTVMRQRDPVLGLIPIDGEPGIALAFRVTYDTNATGTLVTLSPFSRFKHVTNDGYRDRVLPVRSPDRAELVDMLDRVAAESEFK